MNPIGSAVNFLECANPLKEPGQAGEGRQPDLPVATIDGDH